MAALFLGLTGLFALACAGALWRYSLPERRWVSLLVLLAWIVYCGFLGYSGRVSNTSQRVPGLFLLVWPTILFTLVFTVRAPYARELALKLPMALLIGLHVVRLPVELFLHALWKAQLVPRMVTYEGANFDIVTGVTAPIVAFLVAKGKAPRMLLYAWNILGLVLLFNVVIYGVLSAPGPLQRIFDDYPNRGLLQFPYVFLPGFIVPMVLTLHILALRALGAQGKSNPTASAP